MYHINSLYDPPQLSKKKASDLKHMINVTLVCINALTRLNVPICNADHRIVHYLLNKLPASTVQSWEYNLGNSVNILTFSQQINRRHGLPADPPTAPCIGVIVCTP